MDEAQDSCECVIWRDGERRCELWNVGGVGRLRVFDGADLLHEERVLRNYVYSRAQALRNIFAAIGRLGPEHRTR